MKKRDIIFLESFGFLNRGYFTGIISTINLHIIKSFFMKLPKNFIVWWIARKKIGDLSENIHKLIFSRLFYV